MNEISTCSSCSVNSLKNFIDDKKKFISNKINMDSNWLPWIIIAGVVIFFVMQNNK